MSFIPPRGMRDIEPEEFQLQEKIRSTFLEVAALFGFKIMEPSPLEALRTLEAKTGPSIQDEIYFFKDKGGRDLALRFDLTVGITRYIASRKDLHLPAKLGAFSSMWRYDEPQYGRYRWLHQWDVEIFGPTDVESDAEVIDFTSTLMKRVGLGESSIEIGDRRIIEEYIRKILGIDDDAIVIEMLRAVDKVGKKSLEDIVNEYGRKGGSEDDLKKLIGFGRTRGEANKMLVSLEEIGISNTGFVADLMDSIKYRGVKNAVLNMSIVRGLDYYTGIVFEVFAKEDKDLGAIAGGGRYDSLPFVFGRRDLGATGAAGGVERIALALSKKSTNRFDGARVFVAYTGIELKKVASRIATDLRSQGITCETEISGRSLRKQMDAASQKSIRFVVIVAPRELSTGKVVLKDMESGEEEEISTKVLHSEIKSLSDSK